jgi:3-deoxy-D-manno-octulosonic acid kinase
MIQTIQSDTTLICFHTELVTDPSESIFDVKYWENKNLVIGSAQGRGTTWFIQLEKLAGALRHYRRGGLFGKLIKDNYLFTGWQNTRSIAEFNLLRELHKAKINVPRPIAARAVKKGLTYQADLLSEKIPNAQDLVAILIEKKLPNLIYREIGQQVRRMHDCQVNHTDLNIHNILLDDNGKAWIIDFDKCAKQQGEKWKNANLSRLKRSFNKELKKRNILWSENDWLCLIEAYNK